MGLDKWRDYFFPNRNFKVDRGRSNICIFNRFCKALASLLIICPKKFLQESVDHPSNIQPPAAQSIWRFRTWWKLCFFTHYFYWSKLYAFEIKLSFEANFFLDFLKVVRLVFWSGVVGPGTNDFYPLQIRCKGNKSSFRSLALRARTIALRAHSRATRSKARLVSKSNFFFSLTESPPRDLQITAYK